MILVVGIRDLSGDDLGEYRGIEEWEKFVLPVYYSKGIG